MFPHRAHAQFCKETRAHNSGSLGPLLSLGSAQKGWMLLYCLTHIMILHGREAVLRLGGDVVNKGSEVNNTIHFCSIALPTSFARDIVGQRRTLFSTYWTIQKHFLAHPCFTCKEGHFIRLCLSFTSDKWDRRAFRRHSDGTVTCLSTAKEDAVPT